MRLPAAPLFDRPANGLDEDEPLETPCERREPGFAKLRRPSPPNPLLLGAALPLLSLFSLRAPPKPPLEELRDPGLDSLKLLPLELLLDSLGVSLKLRPSPPKPLLLGAALPVVPAFMLRRALPKPPLEELRDPPLDAAPPKPLPRDPSLDSPKLPLANGFLFLSLPKGLPPVGLALLPKFFSELEL